MAHDHRLIAWTAPHTTAFYGPGAYATDAKPGDLVLFKTKGFVGHAIRIGEGIISHTTDKHLKGYTWANHAALLREARATDRLDTGEMAKAGELIVSQMTPRQGHCYARYDGYPADLHCVIRPEMDDDDVEEVLHSDDCMAFLEYGFAQYLGLTVSALTGQKLGIQMGGVICSTAVTMVTQNVALFPDAPSSLVTPAHLAYYFDARVPEGMTA